MRERERERESARATESVGLGGRERSARVCALLLLRLCVSASFYRGAHTEPEARGYTARRKRNEGTPRVHVRVCDAIIYSL